MAVLLDGPGWATRSTVYDRDALPASVLHGAMGWRRVERVWFPMWLNARDEVLADIERAVELAVSPPEVDALPEPELTPPSDPSTRDQQPQLVEATGSSKPEVRGAATASLAAASAVAGLTAERPTPAPAPPPPQAELPLLGGQEVLDHLDDRGSRRLVEQAVADSLKIPAPMAAQPLRRPLPPDSASHGSRKQGRRQSWPWYLANCDRKIRSASSSGRRASIPPRGAATSPPRSQEGHAQWTRLLPRSWPMRWSTSSAKGSRSQRTSSCVSASTSSVLNGSLRECAPDLRKSSFGRSQPEGSTFLATSCACQAIRSREALWYRAALARRECHTTCVGCDQPYPWAQIAVQDLPVGTPDNRSHSGSGDMITVFDQLLQPSLSQAWSK